MNLKKLIANLPIEIASGSKDIEIKGLCAHSRRVAPGDLFIAKKGPNCELYVEEAISNGAVAVLSDLLNPFLKKGVTQLIHPDVASIEGKLAALFYDNPSEKLFTVGITGTNGKTTTGFLIKHLLDKLGGRTGLIGTIEYIIGDFHFEADLTTPDVITNQKLLGEMVKQKCDAAVLEVSSHGLEQHRVDSIAFDAAIFTNLSQDHLDYHKSLEAYAAAKAKLFSMLGEEQIAIINESSSWSATMLENCPARVLSYGMTPDADVHAHEIKVCHDHTEFCVTYKNETALFSWAIVGRFNVLNALAAITLSLSRGANLRELPQHLVSFPQVPGRLERVENGLGLHIYIDFAHTPDALDNVLQTLREFNKRKIFVVFGAGGDRDKEKRPLMGAAVDRSASFGFITSDNPRTEDPFTICEQVAQGFESKHFLIETDRRQAIEMAIKMGEPDDIILIAGKGHEIYQTLSHQTIPFDDRQVVHEIISEVRCT